MYRPDVDSAGGARQPSARRLPGDLINNPGALDRTTIERLDAFVRAGGGLWVALGDQVDKTQFNRDWYSDGDGLSPLELDSLAVIDKPDDVAGDRASADARSRGDAATGQHDATRYRRSPHSRAVDFRRAAAGRRAVSALLESGSGQPLVVEKYVGQGRVLVQAFPLGLEWSNLPLLKSYVVMVHDWLGYVTAPTMARFNLTPGTSIVASRAGGRPRRRRRTCHAARPGDFACGDGCRRRARVSLHANVAAGNLPRAIHERRRVRWAKCRSR